MAKEHLERDLQDLTEKLNIESPLDPSTKKDLLESFRRIHETLNSLQDKYGLAEDSGKQENDYLHA